MTVKATEKKPWIVVVGGFLGAGKTTLILAAARELARLGKRCTVIMNDQGSELVDTRLADLNGLQSGEVTGGCFCCKLSDLVDVAEKLRFFSPDVIFAEPVGSCTDLLATVLRPLQEHGHKYKITPFTVLVDPARADSLLRREADPTLVFFFESR
ncbi:MAG TPA: GTP-binding protein [Terriglobales bacterium]|nr:GTP-binding protein [Terriglobales bacterium]